MGEAAGVMDRDFEETTQITAMRFSAVPKVLIVDDDSLVREQLEQQVAAAGFKVRSVSNGAAALSALRKNFTQILIIDRAMPDMDGLTLVRTIRSEQFDGYVYVVLLTGQDGEKDILAGLDAGADDYLSKRSSAALLVARLRTAQRILALEDSLRAVIREKGRMATTDALTGAHNRRYFNRHFTRELRSATRFGEPLSLLMLDIDHFKQINDRHGHAAGDEVLEEFVRRIATCLPRPSDWHARLGGEEFAVVLPQTSRDGAFVVAEKIREHISAAPIQTTTGALSVTVSVGICALDSLPAGVQPDVDRMLEIADQCLYEAKQAGRNRTVAAGG
jgi:two-component system, cell cycle response regulator